MKAHLYYCMISIIRTIDAKNESNLLNYKENIKIRLFNIVDFFPSWMEQLWHSCQVFRSLVRKSKTFQAHAIWQENRPFSRSVLLAVLEEKAEHHFNVTPQCMFLCSIILYPFTELSRVKCSGPVEKLLSVETILFEPVTRNSF